MPLWSFQATYYQRENKRRQRSGRKEKKQIKPEE
jgi:hypothetical protein